MILNLKSRIKNPIRRSSLSISLLDIVVRDLSERWIQSFTARRYLKLFEWGRSSFVHKVGLLFDNFCRGLQILFGLLAREFYLRFLFSGFWLFWFIYGFDFVASYWFLRNKQAPCVSCVALKCNRFVQIMNWLAHIGSLRLLQFIITIIQCLLKVIQLRLFLQKRRLRRRRRSYNSRHLCRH